MLAKNKLTYLLFESVMNRSLAFARRLRFALPLFAVSPLLSGCVTSTPRGSAERAALRPAGEQIRCPADYTPGTTAFFVHNQIDIQAPPEVVWAIITDVRAWPEWYEGATNLTVHSPDQRVGPGVTVSWRTLGLNFDSVVQEYEPPHRFAWESRKALIQGYHAWLIIPTETGSRVITDESFNGFLATMQRVFLPNKLHRLHLSFLEELKTKAETAVSKR
jgi:uncharacterized protein YndB with AHSA1/START domain